MNKKRNLSGAFLDGFMCNVEFVKSQEEKTSADQVLTHACCDYINYLKVSYVR